MPCPWSFATAKMSLLTFMNEFPPSCRLVYKNVHEYARKKQGSKQKLELTWLSKNVRPKLLPRIRPEDSSKSCCQFAMQ